MNWKELIIKSSIFTGQLCLINAWKIHPGRSLAPFSIKYNKILILTGTGLTLLNYSLTETNAAFISFFPWLDYLLWAKKCSITLWNYSVCLIYAMAAGNHHHYSLAPSTFHTPSNNISFEFLNVYCTCVLC